MELFKSFKMIPQKYGFNEIETYQFQIVFGLLLISGGFLVLIAIANFFDPDSTSMKIAIDLICLAALFLLAAVLYQGKLRLVAKLMLILSFASILIGAAFEGTIRSPGVILFVIPIALSGAIYKARGILVAVIVSALACGFLMAAQTAGILPPPQVSVDPSDWFVYTMALVVCGWFIYLTQSLIQNALEKSIARGLIAPKSFGADELVTQIVTSEECEKEASGKIDYYIPN